MFAPPLHTPTRDHNASDNITPNDTPELSEESKQKFSIISFEEYKSNGNRGMRPTETPAIFESLLSDIMQGRVDEPDRVAFVLTDGKPHQKASIRYGINSLDDVGKARQKNMHYANGPATRAILAKLIAEHIQLCMAAAKQRGMPLMFPEGNELEFDQLVLIEVRWVTTGSIQPVLGYSPLAVVP